MKLKIRRAEYIDCKNIFDLSNDPVVRKNSINQNNIKFVDHILWFENKLSDPYCEYYVLENECNEFVAQVRFDNLENEVYISISVAEKFRGRSLGKNIIQLATSVTSYSEIFAKIRKSNISSYKSFINAGYKLWYSDGEYYILVYIKENG